MLSDCCQYDCYETSWELICKSCGAKKVKTMADVTCPDCDGPMVVRLNRKEGTNFLGCRDYPECTGTLPIDTARDGAGDVDSMPSDRIRRNDSRRWRER